MKNVCVGLLVSCIGSLWAGDVAEIIKALPAQDAAARERVSGALFAEGAAGIRQLCALIVEPGGADDTKARFGIHAMAIHASRPGGDADRKLFSAAVADQLAGASGPHVKAFLLTQLRLTAGEEEIAKIAPLLTDPEVADAAEQTLLSIRGPNAASALRAALPNAKGAAKVTVLTALGTLQDKEAATEIAKDTASDDPAIRNAALHALANIGDASVAPALAKAASVEDWYDRSQATQATLLLAQHLVESGKKDEAAAICRDLIKTRSAEKEHHIQCAALNILAAALGEGAFDDLKTAIKSDSVDVRASALNIAAAIPGEAATQRWVAELGKAEPKARAEILTILGKRHDPSAFAAVAQSISDPDPDSRKAAIEASVIGGKQALPALLIVLGKEPKGESAAEVEAARKAVARLKGAGIDDELAKAVPGASTTLRKALISALSDRGSVAHMEILTAAVGDPDAGIRAAAFESIGFLGDTKVLPVLLDTILKTESDDDRAAAEKAAAALSSRPENRAAAITLVTERAKDAPVKARQSFLRVLGKIGGPEALAAVKPFLKDASPEIVDTAVRELANWQDESALNDLMEIARTSQNLPHHVLALGGYLRLLGAGSKKASNELLPRYDLALAIAQRADEKKKVIAGIQNIKTLEAAQKVEALMEDPLLREEACRAAAAIAKDLAKTNAPAAREILTKVIATTLNEKFKGEVKADLEKIPVKK